MKFEQFHSTVHATSCNILRLQDPASVSFKCFKSCLLKKIQYTKKKGVLLEAKLCSEGLQIVDLATPWEDQLGLVML